jgi:hypothetical protein
MPVAAIAIKARLKTRKILSSPKATVIAHALPRTSKSDNSP